MLRFFLGYLWLLLVAFDVQAGSFDCATTDHPAERDVCDNEKLSQLDDALIVAVRDYHHNFVIDGDTSLAERHERELKYYVVEECIEAATKKDMIACIEYYYGVDIAMMEEWPSFHPERKEGPSFFRIEKFLPNYDIGLKFRGSENCTEEEDACLVEVNLSIHRTRHKNAHQVISIPVKFSVVPAQRDKYCALRYMERFLKNEQGCIIQFLDEELTQASFENLIHVGDYNFDGFSDFAFYGGYKGGFVFLYNDKDGLFYYAPAMSKTLFPSDMNRYDLFRIEVSKKAQEITVIDNSNSHMETVYHVKNNMPEPLRRRYIYRDRDENKDEIVEMEAVWKEGEWRLVRENRKALKEYE